MDNPETTRATNSTRNRRRKTNKKRKHKTENVIDEQHEPGKKCGGGKFVRGKKTHCHLRTTRYLAPDTDRPDIDIDQTCLCLYNLS